MSRHGDPPHLLRLAYDLIALVLRSPATARIALRREFERWCSAPVRALARLHRNGPIRATRLTVVVGSVGKTTTRKALHHALDCPERDFSHSNYGSALAANLLRVRRGDARAVIEAGVGGPGWMRVYASFLRPDAVVVTAIGSDHHRSFPTLAHTRDEKADMVRALGPDGVAFLNGDDPNVRWMATQTRARVVSFGLGPDNDVRGLDLRQAPDGLALDVLVGGRRWHLRSRLTGEHMAYCLLAAIAVAQHEGIELAGAIERLAGVSAEVSRMEVLTLPSGVTLIDDSQKGSLESTLAAIEALSVRPAGRRIVVFGDVEDAPGKLREYQRQVGERIGAVADVVYWIGGRSGLQGVRVGAARSGLPAECIHALDTDPSAAGRRLIDDLRAGDVVLIKGRSSLQLRRLVLALCGRRVSCDAQLCRLRVRCCDDCPLLDAPASLRANHFVTRYQRN